MPTFEEKRAAKRAAWLALKKRLRAMSVRELEAFYASEESGSLGSYKLNWLVRLTNRKIERQKLSDLIWRRQRNLPRTRSPYTSPMSRFRQRIVLLGRPNDLTKPVGFINKYSNGVRTEHTPVFLTGSTPSRSIEYSWDQVNKVVGHGSRSSYSGGGPFLNIKCVTRGLEVRGASTYTTKGNPGFGPNSWWEYVGGFYNPSMLNDPTPQSLYLSGGGAGLIGHPFVPSVDEYGPQAYKLLRPKLSKGDMFQFLYELRDAPRMLRQTAAGFHDLWKSLGGKTHTPFMSPKRVADEYLNHQFGWVPFIGDISKISDAVIFSRQYEADITSANNTWVKRRVVLKNEDTMDRLGPRNYTIGCEPVAVTPILKSFVVDGVTCVGYNDLYRQSVSKVWGEGSFKYYRPEFDSSLSSYNTAWAKADRLMTIYGMRVNPSTLYKVVPWSWLIDWFSQTGDLIDQAVAQGLDGVVSRYMYVMRHEMSLIRSIHLISTWSGAATFEWTRNIESKQRRSADSPYDFFLTSKDLTARQWTILGALGLSRNVNITRYF